MIRVADIFAFLDEKAPLATAEPWDNPGLLVGQKEAPVRTVLTALDITPDVVRQAGEAGAQLIVAHHPVIFHPLSRLPAGHPAALLAAAGISALCWHTNLDKAPGGVADTLAAALELTDVAAPDGYVRIGRLPQRCEPAVFTAKVNEQLRTRCRGCSGTRPVETVAVFGGALDEESLPAMAAADAVVFGECKHHVRLELARSGQTVCEAGHFATEQAIAGVLADWLREAFPQLTVVTARERAPFIG